MTLSVRGVLSTEWCESAPLTASTLDLYESVGWSAYTREPEVLLEALRGSSWVGVAEEDGALLGLIRVISDGASLCYVQDILVRPVAQRRGVGRALFEEVSRRYAHVRQLVLLTDDDPAQHAFYQSLGLRDIAEDGKLHSFIRFA